MKIHDANIYLLLNNYKDKILIFNAIDINKNNILLEFNHIFAYKIENELSGNIILDIEEVEIKTILKEEEKYFIKNRQFGWPEIKYSNINDLINKTKEYKAYNIYSSYGLSGWIIAKIMIIEKGIIEYKIIKEKSAEQAAGADL